MLNLLGLGTEDNKSKTHYAQFVHRLLQDGLLSFFQKYPVLGRFVATQSISGSSSRRSFCNDWLKTVQIFSKFFAQHQGDVPKPKSLPSKPRSPIPTGKVEGILLTLASGLKLAGKKPKDLGLEVTFNQFLDWCNQHSQLLDFKVIQVLNRDGYGWVEYVEHQPCLDEVAAERLYQRVGMLLCVLYALRATDCHREDLIASSEHLVLIDMETLLHHEANLIEISPFIQEFEQPAAQHLWDSVLRTGLLPRVGL